MAKQKLSKVTAISACGTLDKNEEGKFILTVETKDTFKEYDLEDILNEMVGTEISLSSSYDLI